ncbi:Rnf-Nqr domain containing protein [Gemmiger sp.]
MQQRPNKRRNEDRSETLIIPHITKEMVEVARRMAEQGASRAEIEQAIAAMQVGKTPDLTPKKPIVQKHEAPAAPRNTAAHSDTVITPTSRPRYTQAERRAMLEEVQRRQAEREAARQAEARAEESRFRSYRDREYGTNPAAYPPAAEKPAAKPAAPAADATRTIQMPRAAAPVPPTPQPDAQPTQVIPPVQAAPAAPAAAEPPRTVPTAQPAHTDAPKRNALPSTYKEAEAQLNERIRADHIWLSNPVLVRGLGLAPVVGAALDGRRALMLCIAALILVTFTRVLAVAVCHLTKNRFRPVIYCYAAALLYIPTYVLLYALFGADLTLLGIYLPLLVVEPAIVKRMEFAELEPVKDAFRHGFNNALGMCVVLLIVGCLRELLATGAVFGQTILRSALLPLAALPAGGFVILGILAAVWCAVANLYTDYKHEEVRRLYDRKH